MVVARDIMTSDPVIVDLTDSVVDVAKLMEAHDIGVVIVCSDEGRLEGMVSDRDLAVQVIGAGRDPSSATVGDLVGGREVVTIGADDSIDLAIDTMQEHAVRRLPVIDGDEVVGIISQADLADHADPDQVGRLVEVISSAPDNTAEG